MSLVEDRTSASAAIRAAGLRVTLPRQAVYEALQTHPHASADDVLGQVRGNVPQANLQSVYNALHDFAEAGLVRRIEPAGHTMLFELRVSDNHHHLICTGCGAVQDVDCATGAAPCLTPNDARGFEISVAEVTYWGLCSACQSS